LTAISFLGIAFLQLPVRAADPKLEDIRNQARQAEKDKDWAKACSYYAFILTRDRNSKEDRESFQTCLRHLHRVRRHMDSSYRQQVLEQDVSVAFKVYGEVLTQLRNEYGEEDKADINSLFKQGLQELRLALNDETFRKLYLGSAKTHEVEAFLAKVNDQWGNKKIRNTGDAQNQSLRIALLATKQLGIKPTVVVLEFACGACNALDEHTYYMTPRQFGDDLASLRGESVGIGIELEPRGRKLVISQVVMNSPAARAGLNPDDEITRINQTPAEKLSAEAANERLKGKLGTAIDLEVISGDQPARVVTLVRAPINASVTRYYMMDRDIGYIALVSFHENTLQELDEAIRNLEMQGLKGLILDLRGNAGGLFDSAVQVAERFLWEGAYIVSTRGKIREVKRISRNPNPLAMPVVVLVDGGTASAGEILAGALKENFTPDMQSRATLVGMPTFGKGTVQHMVELKTVQAGGIRITWAKFFSPRNHAYNGIGVEPHIKIDDRPGQNNQITEAVRVARELINRPVTMMR
jgi:carboxyl-terminal processing protease